MPSMCLIALAWRASSRFPLVIAGNRDEFLARPTLPLDVWQSTQGTLILGGRDGQDGGSWMGFTPQGRFAALTNVRNPQASAPAHPISRGRLVVDWLDSSLDAPSWAAQLQAEQFNGFNLLAGDAAAQQCFYLSRSAFFKPNQGEVYANKSLFAIENIAIELSDHQVYGLSNAALNTAWPKTLRLQKALRDALTCTSSAELASTLLRELAHAEAAPDALLPSTGVPLELERALSSAFISHPAQQPQYGTRTSWVAVLDEAGKLEVSELTHSHDTQPPQLSQRQLDWQSAALQSASHAEHQTARCAVQST